MDNGNGNGKTDGKATLPVLVREEDAAVLRDLLTQQRGEVFALGQEVANFEFAKSRRMTVIANIETRFGTERESLAKRYNISGEGWQYDPAKGQFLRPGNAAQEAAPVEAPAPAVPTKRKNGMKEAR